ncbi:MULTISPECIES: hypothetical protein [unclassified Micromonospora]|uniref:hypothetical protein n=1 Tax=unclassified Micromonospora TaxID=2617518 RepID=UPI002FF3D105
MAMVDMPAARRHHRSRIGYAFGLLALVAVTTLVVVVRYPAESTTRLAEPVPAPEITVVEQGSPPPDAGDYGYGYADESDYPGDPAAPGDHPYDGTAPDSGADASADPHDGTGSQPGAGGGEAALAGTADARQALSQSLFYSGLLGLTISLAGLGLVGTRRRMW